MDPRDKVLELVKELGPSLPRDINKEIDTNVLFASAMLSEMVDAKKLKLTNLKVGSSPLYYSKGQEPDLQKFIKHLGQKPQRVCELLRENKILRDIEQEPLTRACLREIKDFAIPLEVTAKGNKEIFWKWYLLTDAQATDMISKILKPITKQKTIPKVQPIAKPIPVQKPIAKPEPKAIPKPETKDTIKPAPIQPAISEPAPEAEVATLSATETAQTELSEPTYSHTLTTSIRADIYSSTIEAKKAKPNLDEVQETLEHPLVLPSDDPFFSEIQVFFDKNKIEVLEFSTVRKASEFDMIITLPSNVGSLTYYCKAKSKKTINDGDLSSAFVQGSIKKLPVLFLTKGKVTKKAESLLATEFKSMTLKNIKE